MEGKLKKLKNTNGEYVFPVTRGEAVFVEDNKTLAQKLTEIGTGSTGSNSEFSGKVLNVLGDSLTEVNSHSTKQYHTFLKEWLGLATVNNYGQSGSTISSTHLPMSTRYSTMDANADIILVFGGVNDHGKNTPLGVFADTTNETFYGALHVLCQGLITKYPGKKIGFIAPHQWFGFGAFQNPNTNGATLEQFVNAMVEVCKYYSIPILDLYHEGNMYLKIAGQKTLYTTDGLHFNITGHERLAGKAKEFLYKL